MHKFTIAIDGPAAAGKTTNSKAIAERLGIQYIDTGAIYRTIGLAAIRAEKILLPADQSDITQEWLDTLKIEIQNQDNEQRMILNGEDVSNFLRTERISMAASDCSALPIVRKHLLKIQRDLAESKSSIMEGRDIGTVVLPDATVKIFLTASPESRTIRRLLQLGLPHGEYHSMLSSINKRDKQDMNRKEAPLRKAEDAILIDSTNMTLQEVQDAIFSIVINKIGI